MESVSVGMPHACILSLRHTLIEHSAVTPGAAANAVEDGKRRKYAALTVRFRFEPVALETAGVFGRRMSEVTGDCRETYWLELRKGLDVQRGNALCILAAIRAWCWMELDKYRPAQFTHSG